MQVISASDLARKTSAVLESILTGETVSVMRNRTEIAHIVPVRRTMSAAQAVAGLEGRLTQRDGAAWLRESRPDLDEEVRDPWA